MLPFIVRRSDWSLHRIGDLDSARHYHLVQQCLQEQRYYKLEKGAVPTNIADVANLELAEYRFRYDQLEQPTTIDTGIPTTTAGSSASESALGESLLDPEAQALLGGIDSDLYLGIELPGTHGYINPDSRLFTTTTPFSVFTPTRRGPWCRRNSLMNACRRAALQGSATLQLQPEDMRYRKRCRTETPHIVVLALMDTSGSMWAAHKSLSRLFHLHLDTFLRANYPHAEIIYIVHDTQAREVTASEFFRRHERGGTCCSSAFDLALHILSTRFPQQNQLIYVFYTGDCHNLESDNAHALRSIASLQQIAQLVACTEVSISSSMTPTLFGMSRVEIGLQHLRFARLSHNDRIPPVLRSLLAYELL